MLTKAWIAILMGLLLGSLLFSSGCGWGGGYSNNPYYGAPCNCGAPQFSGTPTNGLPAAGSTPGWRVPVASGSAAGSGGATTGGSATATP